MLYVRRDTWGNLQQVEAAPFDGMDGEIAAGRMILPATKLHLAGVLLERAWNSLST